MRVPYAAALNPANALTIEAWVNLGTGARNACVSIVGKGWQNAYWMGVCDGSLRSYVRGNSSVVTGGSVPLDTWTHLAITTDGTTRMHYVNGNLVYTAAEATSTTLGTSTKDLSIGNDVDWDYAPVGRIDEVRLWSVARTKVDIQRTMRVALDTAESGLIGVWHLDGNGNDKIGTNNGTLTGSATFSAPPAGGFCTPSDTQLCLSGGRYLVTAKWKTANGATGSGRVVPGFSYETGLFWFFAADNWELMVKTLNGCPVNNRRWVYSAATTDVEYDLTVRDLVSGEQKTYHNTLGTAAPAVTDAAAFSCTGN